MQAVAYLRGVGLRARATTVSGNIVPAVHVLVPTSREADKAKAELNKFASPADLAAVHPGVMATPERLATLEAWVRRHYRDRLSIADLADPALLAESRRALDELTGILDLPGLYGFQR